MLVAAGLDLAELHVMERVRRMASAREMIDFMEASWFGNFLSAIPEDLRDSFRADFERAILAHQAPEGFATRDYGAIIVGAQEPANGWQDAASIDPSRALTQACCPRVARSGRTR